MVPDGSGKVERLFLKRKMPPKIQSPERLSSSRYTPPERVFRCPNGYDPREEPVFGSRDSGANIRAKGDKVPGRHVTFTPLLYSRHYKLLETRNIRPRQVSSIYTEQTIYKRVVSHPKSLPERLKISKVKGVISPAERIKELTRENRCLRQEITYYKEI